MIDYETIARSNHASGMNCASAVYDALGMNNPNMTTPPRPRENGGMCGAVLAAEQVIRETEEPMKTYRNLRDASLKNISISNAWSSAVS